MKKVKIVHLTSVHPPFDPRIFKQCKCLVEAGYVVTLIVPCDCEEVADGVRIKAVPKPKGRVSRMTRTVWRIYREALRQDADLYHFHDPELIPAGLLLRARRKKVIYDVHENVPSQIRLKDWIPSVFRPGVGWAYHCLERQAAKQYSAIVTANEDISELVYEVSEHVVAIHNYARVEEFPADRHTEDSRFSSGVVIHSGGIDPRIPIHAIIRAMRLVPERLGARLIVTSGGSDSEALFREVVQIPGWERVDYRGTIPRQEVMGLLGGAGVALVLYRRADNYLSIRSNRFFEAMAAGLPVITSNFPEWREAVEGIGCGLTVEPEDPEAIASAIAYLLTHPAQAAEMGKRGRQAVLDKFNWTKEKPKLLHLYQDLLDDLGRTCF
jgi:glycosyltransferase involved in cell wall biosynthesis